MIVIMYVYVYIYIDNHCEKFIYVAVPRQSHTHIIFHLDITFVKNKHTRTEKKKGSTHCIQKF